MVVYNFVEQCFRPEMIKAGMLQARRIVDKNKVQTIFRHLPSECRNEAWFSHREYWRKNRKQYPGLRCDLLLWQKLWFQTIKHGPIFKRALLSSKQDRLLREEGERGTTMSSSGLISADLAQYKSTLQYNNNNNNRFAIYIFASFQYSLIINVYLFLQMTGWFQVISRAPTTTRGPQLVIWGGQGRQCNTTAANMPQWPTIGEVEEEQAIRTGEVCLCSLFNVNSNISSTLIHSFTTKIRPSIWDLHSLLGQVLY